MIQTSAAYAPFAQVRQVDALISFEVLAKTLNKKDIDVTAPAARLGNGDGTINGIPELAAKYATLERYGWPLDGSCSVMPATGKETGFWSSAVSGDDGDFDEPITFRYDLPDDTITFGWTFHFDAPAMIAASRVKAVCYDANGDIIDTAEGYVEGTVDPPRPAVTVGIEPVQDLHGYDAPWPAGGGKNLLDFESVFTNGWTYTASGLTATYNNGIMKVTGTNESTGWVNIVEYRSRWSNDPYSFGAGNYIASEHITLRCYVDGGTISNRANAISPTTSLSITGFYIAVASGQTVDWSVPLVFCSGTTRPTTYSPYSNICPITGWTGANIYVSPTSDPADGRTYSVSFPSEAGTVYGGTLDVTSGVLTVDRASVLLNNPDKWQVSTGTIDFIYTDVFPDRKKYENSYMGLSCTYMRVNAAYQATQTARWSGAASSYFGLRWSDGTLEQVKADASAGKIAIVYELAAPVTYQLTPVEIARILETDNVWADCGPVLEIGEVPGNRQEIKKTSSGWSFQHWVQNYRAVEFTFYGTNLPRRMLRLAEVDFGISKHFNRDGIKNARIKYGMAPDASAFPAKEIVFTFDNSDGDFNVLNPVGVYQYWRNGQVLVARIKVGDEIVPMGMFYVTKAEIGENRLLAKVTAHDPCYQLANQKFYPQELAEASSVRLDQAVPRALLGTDLAVNYGGLGAELVSVAVRDTHDKRVILRYLAQAARATCWIDRDNVLRFRRIVTAEEEDSSITADELYDWSGVSIAEEYTGVTLTVRRELEQDESGGEVTETYHAGIASNEGMAVASYENPCVAPGQGQAVAEWLLTMANRRKKYEVKNRCDPAVEIGDTLVIADAFHNDDRAVITGLDIQYDGGLSCVTEADREF